MKYNVIVGNIGCVYRGNNRATAVRIFSEYKAKSQSGLGRAAQEPVQLTDIDGIPIKEYYASRTN